MDRLIDKRHPDYMLTHYICSEKCYELETRRNEKWNYRMKLMYGEKWLN